MKKALTITLLSLLGLAVVGSSTTLIWNSVLTNDELFEYKDSLVTKQVDYEKDFTTKGSTLQNPLRVDNPYKISPLTSLIMFHTVNPVSVTVTIKGKDTYTDFTHTFPETTEHYLPIYGLYADYDNQVIIKCSDGSENIIHIKTDKLPDNFKLATINTSQKDKITKVGDNTLYFFTPAAIGYTSAYDVNGDVRWYLDTTAPWSPARLKNGHLLIGTERRVNPPYYVTGLYEMDMLGKIYNEYTLEGGYHHDFDELPNGNLLVATDDFNSGNGTVEDCIVELDRKTGKVVKKFNLLNEVLDKKEGQSENWSEYDWFHNNAVWYDAPTDSITLSGRHQDAVINISHETGKLNWIIGDKTNWSEKYHKYFFDPITDKEHPNFEWQWSQHAAMMIPETEEEQKDNIHRIFVFDNGNNKSKIKEEYVPAENSYSRGVIYEIDTENMTIKQDWEYGKERGSEFYSPYISDVDYLAEDHYIVHSGGIVSVDGKPSNQPAGLTKGDVVLTSKTVELVNDEVVLEMEIPTNNYRVEKMSAYTSSDDEFKVGAGHRLGGFEETHVDNNKFGLMVAHAIDDEYKARGITITQEEDRVVVHGTYNKDSEGIKTDKVEIILYNNMRSKVYNVVVANRPYTALCIDIFTKDEVENGKKIRVDKYISKEGLKGKYSVLIKLNGKIYNTGKSVKF